MATAAINLDDLDVTTTALRLASRGWQVFPVNPTTKQPPKGFPWRDRATTDEDTIRFWFSGEYLEHGVAIATGQVSGVYVVDADEYKSTYDPSWYDLEALDTYKVSTASGGTHLYFTSPLKNGNGVLPGVDVKGDGGYVVAENGITRKVLNGTDPVEAPVSLVERLQRAKPSATPSEPVGRLSELGSGSRNDALNHAAFALAKSGVSEETARGSLQSEYVANGYIAEHGLPAFNATFESGFYKGLQGDQWQRPKLDTDDFEIKHEVLSLDEMMNLPPPEWLLENWLQRKSLAMIYGAPGAGKTFLAMHWAFSNPIKVLYIMAEGCEGMGVRTNAWQDVYGPVKCDSQWIPDAVDLQGPQTIEFLLEQGEGCDLIVFDTLARCTPGAEENSAKDMGTVVRNLELIKKETGACVLPLHHPGKDSSNGPRGSSALMGAFDTAIGVVRSGNMLEVRTAKQKNGRDDLATTFAMRDHLGSLVLGEPTMGETILSLPKSQKVLYDILEEHEPLTPGEWAARADMTTATFGRHRRALEESGWIVKRGTTYHVA